MSWLASLFGREKTFNTVSNRVAELLSNGPWLVAPGPFQAFLERLGAWDPGPRADMGGRVYERPTLKVENGIATIQLRGLLMKRPPSWACEYGWATDLLAFTALINEARTRSDVESVIIDGNTPGGTVAGTPEAAEAVFELRATKPVVTICEDLLASAGYWIAAQSTKIIANPTALIGSVGVYSVLYDASAYSEMVGIKVDVVRSKPLKGTGVFGAPISAEARAKEQSLVDSTAALFTAAIVRGRPGLSGEQVSTGEVWLATDALGLGLIDEVTGSIPVPVGTDEPEESESPIEPPDPDGDENASARSESTATHNPQTQRESAGGQAMANENPELVALRAKLAETEARASAAEADKLKAETKLQAEKEIRETEAKAAKTAAIEAAIRSGVAAAHRPAMEKVAAVSSLDELQAFVASMPRSTKPSATGTNPSQGDGKHAQATDGELKYFGHLPKATIAKAQEIESYGLDGTVTLKGGRQVALAEFMKEAN